VNVEACRSRPEGAVYAGIGIDEGQELTGPRRFSRTSPRDRFVCEGNLDKVLAEEPRPGAKRKLSDREEALLFATTCSRPPEGRSRWTIELLPARWCA
jgi:hypothetical protein